ncbi:Tol-Pal system beta propeller repeat protein TolB [Commensalibacter oyaizuii]
MRPIISDNDADILRDVFIPRRSVLYGCAVGGIMVTPLSSAFAQAGKDAAGAAEITVDRARNEPIPIVIPNFGSGNGGVITQVVTSDLNNTGLFRVISSTSPTPTPDFASYKAMGARAVVTGSVSGGRVEFRLWNALTGQQIQGTAYSFSGNGDARRVAHMIGDVIYERLLGEKGYFNTRIAYVSQTGRRTNPTKRLAVMDYDGANNRILTNGKWLVLTPRFSPVSNQIAFMSYVNDRPRVYLFNLQTGQQRLLGDFTGISFAPRFSPDGRSVIMSVTRGAGSDIYVVDLASGSKRQITSSGAIDTSPCFSPDGSQIVFSSDRGGKQQLYVMSASGGGAHRISYGSGSYANPVWSPRGDVIAFVRIGGGGFSLGTMAPDGTGERILTQGFTVESPTFCPNGRVLAFCNQSASSSAGGFSSSIRTIGVNGFNERSIPTSTMASGPSWSSSNT